MSNDSKIGKPIASIVRFHGRSTLHSDVAELVEIDHLVVHATHETVRLDNKLHESLLLGRAEDASPRTIDEQPVQHGLHRRKFRGHAATQ